MTQKYHININVGLKSYLDGAFSIDVKRSFVKEQYFFFHGEQGWEKTDVYDILTNDGGFHITLHQAHLKDEKYITAYIKSSLKSVSIEDALEMVKTSIENETFLTYDNYKEYSVEVYDKKAMKEMIS